MSKTPSRILVLTLYSGENELEICKKSVASQKGVDITHETFENLPNIEAHRKLYARIMEQSKNYDWFVKLDADMVLNSPNALQSAIEYMNDQDNETAMAIFTVQDWPTNMPIWGMNIFSPSCRWKWVSEGAQIPDRVFVDPDPAFEGVRLIVNGAPSPLADHMPDPSEWQSFFFGFHRGLKALSMDGNKPSSRSKTQWKILCAVGAHHRINPDRRLALILSGAEYARNLDAQGLLPKTLNKDDADLKGYFETIQAQGNAQLDKIAQAFWGSQSKAMRHWYFKRGGWRLLLGKFL